MRKIKFILTIFVLLIFFVYTVYITNIPKNIVLIDGEKTKIRNLIGIQKIETVKTSNNGINEGTIDFKLFGNINLKSINVTNINDLEVILIGKIIGLKLYTNGVLIVGTSNIEDSNNLLAKPYENSDLKVGDTIIEINNEKIESIKSLKEIVKNSGGNLLNIKLLREGEIINTNITPIKSNKNEYKLGLWVKDAATGVGTITFYEPNTNAFGILGHGINDSDTGKLIDIDSGKLVTTQVISIVKGSEGLPGEIKGTILNQEDIGIVSKNTDFGVFGTLNNLTLLNIDTSKRYKVASRDEIEVGDAKVLCAIENNTVKEYDIKIEKIYKDNNETNKSMQIRVTDEELIEKTGGIIRGLSGAPIVQNGKFVGAITNVLVSNPEVGYAIFGDLMVKEIK